MKTKSHNGDSVEDPRAGLERALIEEYLAEKGHSLHSLKTLSTERQLQLLSEATTYATLRLTELRITGAIR